MEIKIEENQLVHDSNNTGVMVKPVDADRIREQCLDLAKAIWGAEGLQLRIKNFDTDHWVAWVERSKMHDQRIFAKSGRASTDYLAFEKLHEILDRAKAEADRRAGRKPYAAPLTTGEKGYDEVVHRRAQLEYEQKLLKYNRMRVKPFVECIQKAIEAQMRRNARELRDIHTALVYCRYEKQIAPDSREVGRLITKLLGDGDRQCFLSKEREARFARRKARKAGAR